MMQLFVTYVFQKWNVGNTSPLHVGPANIDSLVIDFKELSVAWRGKTDLYCFRDGLDGKIYNSKAVIEMKVPFDSDSLFHSKALQPKQQLLGQSIGLFRKKGKKTVVLYPT